ncbi:glycosyltransferase family 39 protein [Lactiplantibacillus herbarum]|uniref:glycosyltransferase family 39 protein n=1 Tax=Lactiplantibacillus herbarum TaxID=1670446 RepID=UPI00064EE1CD|nr:glycosyltransferase family 39 protein [Lactiplantibacillus herbarum]
MAILGLIFFCLALIGYSSAMRWLHVNPYLTWITGILVQINLLYIFAMLDWLRIGIWVVTSLGVLLLGLRLMLGYLGHVHFHYEGIHLFDIWMAFLGLVMALVLFRSPLVHYDNFSHWATIVKFLTYTGHLPGASDTIISFTSYPPATALFMTQFVTFVGFSSGAMLVAQFALIWAASYAIFATLRDRTRGLNSMLLCLVIAISYVFNINIRLNNLLVDYVLAVLTMAALVGTFIYRHRPRMQAAHVALFSGSLLLVKNSAAFFVAIVAGYYLYMLIHNISAKRWFKKVLKVSGMWLGTLLVAVLPFIWWEVHVKLTFTTSKHEISASAYQSQLSHDGMTGLLSISQQFLKTIFSLSSLSTQGFLALNILLIGAWAIIKYGCHHPNDLLKIISWLDLASLLYYFSLLGMYVLSMPYDEAITLDGFERYMSTIVILNLFIGAIVLVRVIDETFYEQDFESRSPRNFQSIWTKNGYQLATFLVMFFAVIMMYSEINGTNFTNHYNRRPLPVMLTKIAKPTTNLNNTKILIVDPQKVEVTTYYAGYLANYYFFTNNTTGQAVFSKSATTFKKNINQYQYIAVPKYDKSFAHGMYKFYHQRISTGLFKVESGHLRQLSTTSKIN